MSDPAQADSSSATPVTVTLPADSRINKAPGWFVTRLGESTTKAAIISVGMAWTPVIQAEIMHNPARFLIAAAVQVTFLGLVAFAYKESPGQIRIEAAQQQAPAGIQVNTETPHA